MKNSITALLSSCILAFSFSAFGQAQKIPLNEPDYNRPKAFQNLPDSISVDEGTLAGLFNLSKGQKAAPKFSNRNTASEFQLRGEVVSKSDNTPLNAQAKSAGSGSLSSMIMKLSDYAGSNFTISKITDPDGSIRYTGRIINFKSGDLFDLKNINGKIMLIKKDYYALVNE